jgi:hypothetical protein
MSYDSENARAQYWSDEGSSSINWQLANVQSNDQDDSITQLSIEKLRVKIAYVAKQITSTKASLQTAGKSLPLDDAVKLRQSSVRIGNLVNRLDQLLRDQSVLAKRFSEALDKQKIPPALPPGDYRFWVRWDSDGEAYQYLVLGLPDGRWYTTSVTEKGSRTWGDLMIRFRTKAYSLMVERLVTVGDSGPLHAKLNAVGKLPDEDDD